MGLYMGKPKTSARPYTVLDMFMYKPRENTFYKTLQMPAILEAALPLSARYPVVENTMQEIMGNQYTPMCKVQPRMITTFDNVTLPYALNDCYHLITNPEVFGMTCAQTQCRSEMSIPECIREVSRPVHHQQMEFPSMVRESGPLKYITKVENRGEEICFSVKPVAVCALGHEATTPIRVEMGFHCVSRGRAAT